MIQLLIQIFILLANIVAVLLVYYSFGRTTDKQKRFFGTMISIGLMYIVVLIVYSLSSIGIEQNSSSDTAKQLYTMSFVPINAIIIEPLLIHSYIDTKNKKIQVESLNRRAIIIIIVSIILLTWEFFFFRNTQKQIIETQNKLQQNANSSSTNLINNVVINNEVIDNTNLNTIKTNNVAELNNKIDNTNTVKTKNTTINNTTKQ